MSSEATAVVQAALDAFAARDYERMRECMAPDTVSFGTQGGIDEGQVIRGAEASIRYLREIDETWRRYDVSVEQLVEVGDAVVAFLRERGTARHAELEVETATAIVYVVRDGKIAEATGYLDRDAALAAASARRASAPR